MTINEEETTVPANPTPFCEGLPVTPGFEYCFPSTATGCDADGYCAPTWEEYCSTVPELCNPTTTTTVEVATGTPPTYTHTLPATGGTPIIGIMGLLFISAGLFCRRFTTK